jgi:hypothetical protein
MIGLCLISKWNEAGYAYRMVSSIRIRKKSGGISSRSCILPLRLEELVKK